jgi:hypothetical protein
MVQGDGAPAMVSFYRRVSEPTLTQYYARHLPQPAASAAAQADTDATAPSQLVASNAFGGGGGDGGLAVALFDFEPQRAGDLRLTAAQVIVLVDTQLSWWMGHPRGRPAEVGMFPHNYVRLLPTPAPGGGDEPAVGAAHGGGGGGGGACAWPGGGGSPRSAVSERESSSCGVGGDVDFDVLQGEIVAMLAALRLNSRFRLQGLYGGAHALVHGLKHLASEVMQLPLGGGVVRGARVDAHSALKPFLAVVQSEECSGPVTVRARCHVAAGAAPPDAPLAAQRPWRSGARVGWGGCHDAIRTQS